MIQVGAPAMFGVTFDAPGLPVAFRAFDSTGTPLAPWAAALNYDGNSYQLPLTFLTAGAFSVKKVCFTDGTFTTRDPDRPEADDAVQVADFRPGSAGEDTVIGIVDDDAEVIA